MISALFSKGDRIALGKVALVYEKNLFSSLHYGVSVPKKKVSLAVHRNRLKRLLRECIRLYFKQHPQLLLQAVGLFVIFNGNRLLSFEELKENVFFLLDRFFYPGE